MNEIPITPIRLTPSGHAALLASIAHWRRMETGDREQDEIPVGSYCDLCNLFADGEAIEENRACKGCPVRQRTGYINCTGSLYLEAAVAWHEHGITSAQFRDCAKVEREFLESLLVDAIMIEEKENVCWD